MFSSVMVSNVASGSLISRWSTAVTLHWFGNICDQKTMPDTSTKLLFEALRIIWNIRPIRIHCVYRCVYV